MRSEVDKVVSSKEGEAKAARQEALKALRDAKDYAGEVARLKGEKEAKEKEVRWLFCQSGGVLKGIMFVANFLWDLVVVKISPEVVLCRIGQNCEEGQGIGPRGAEEGCGGSREDCGRDEIERGRVQSSLARKKFRDGRGKFKLLSLKQQAQPLKSPSERL